MHRDGDVSRFVRFFERLSQDTVQEAEEQARELGQPTNPPEPIRYRRPQYRLLEKRR